MSGTRVVLEGPGKFDYGASDLRAEWKRWKRGFNSWLIGAEQDGKKEAVKLNLLLTLLGSEGQDICETFEWPDANRTLEGALERLDSHFAGLSNVTMARFRFFSCVQDQASITEFLTTLKTLANDCDFGDLKDSLVKDMVVINCSSVKLRERLLKEPKLDLTKAVEIARIGEEAERNVETISREAGGGSAGALVAGKSGTHSPGRIGYRRPWKFDGDCFECGERGHMARDCPRKPNEEQTRDSNASDDSGRHPRAGYAVSYALNANMRTSGCTGWYVDSGASEHMTPDRDCFSWYEPYRKPRKVTLGDGEVVLAYGQGETSLRVRAAAGVARVSVRRVQFVPKLQMSLLSVPATTKLGNEVKFQRQACVVSCGSLRLQCPVNEYGLYEVPILQHGGDQLGTGQLGTTGGCPTPGGVTGKSEYRNNLNGHGKDQWKADSPEYRTMDGWRPRFQDSRIKAGWKPRFQDYQDLRTKAGGQGYPGASTRNGTKAGGHGLSRRQCPKLSSKEVTVDWHLHYGGVL